MYEVSQQLTPCKKGNDILTDGKAPVELLGIQVIDGIIEREVEYYKGIYEEQGFRDFWKCSSQFPGKVLK